MENDPLRLVAQHLLEQGLPELATQSMDRLVKDETSYAGMDAAELRQHMERTLRLALLRLAGAEVPARLELAAYQTGQLRAYQGMDLHGVLHSFRIDLRILWEAVIDHGDRFGVGAEPRFAKALVRVWEVVEENIADVIEGYNEASERMNRELEESRAAAFARLIAEGDHRPDAVTNGAEILGLPVEGIYLCLSGSVPATRWETVNAAVARLRRRHIAFHLDQGADHFACVVLLRGLSVPEAVSLLAEFQQFACGAFDVEGLGAVPKGLRLARAATRGHHVPGILLLRERWSSAIALSDRELADALVSEVLSPLGTRSDHERAAFLETLEAFFAGEGSVADIAARTYLHRNTVRKRLQSLREITGLNLSRPGDIATLKLAFDIQQGDTASSNGEAKASSK